VFLSVSVDGARFSIDDIKSGTAAQCIVSLHRRIGNLKKAHVLLVDDEKDFADVMKERLELAGYTVTACYDVEQALKAVQDEEYDVAIIDLIMPDTDGITAMHRIKLIRPLMECIVLSGQGTLRMAVESMKQGAFDFLEKPCENKVVTQIIDEACARKREQDNRIHRAASKVYARLEKAMVGATFAEAGEFDTAREILRKKEKE
jgi:DNA-binding NtrC family response regulator